MAPDVPAKRAAAEAAAAVEHVALRRGVPPEAAKLFGMKAAVSAAARTASFVASQEWCLRMAEIEGDSEIGAGRLAIDPVFDDCAPL